MTYKQTVKPTYKMPQGAKALIGSHTFVDTFARCPKQAFHRYVAKDQPFVESEEMRWGNLVHSAMEHRCGKEAKPLPETMQAYEKYALPIVGLPDLRVEYKIGIERNGVHTGFFNSAVWFRGKVDILSKQGNTAFIVDWKTGKKREDPSELEEHALMVKCIWPEIETIKGCYVWLKTDEMGTIHDLSHFSMTFERVQRYMTQAEKLLADDIEWPARENPLCGWCSVKSCKFNPEYEQ